MEKGLVNGKIILTDSTHVKASASAKKNMKVMVGQETTDYMERLDPYEAEERERLEATQAIKPQGAGLVKKAKVMERMVNLTDPDSGLLRRPGKPDQKHYLSHQQ